MDKVAKLDPDEKLIIVMGMTGAGKTTVCSAHDDLEIYFPFSINV
jgi:RNase adaptor protein for sRNA GlmZ degradation